MNKQLTLLGVIGQGCRIKSLRGKTLYAHKKMYEQGFPASECSFGACTDSCCKDGCRLSYEDLVALLPFMSVVAEKHGLQSSGFSMKFIGSDYEPGYEYNRGFTNSSSASGCVFLEPESRACRLHAEALLKGLSWQKHKPFTCVLFPVRLRPVKGSNVNSVMLSPSKEPSICQALSPSCQSPRSTRSFLDVKMQDIRFLFDL